MKKFFIRSMGCKSNQFEGQVIRENLIKNGFSEVKDVEEADIFVLNSCSVTHKSDNEALYFLRAAKNKNPNIFNVLTGCYAQIEKETLLECDFIDFIAGNDEKLKLGEYMLKAFVSGSRSAVSDIMQRQEFTHVKITDTAKTRISLKIQDGCNNRCAYCIIPFARGNSRSANSDFIVNQINYFCEHGFKEVVFTGIHIGLWGNEFGKTLSDLLKEVEVSTNIERYRLGSLYPNEIDEYMLDFLSKSEKFCPHFHLSLQAACDKTLRTMNRFYTVEETSKLIEKINNIFDLPFIGSDVIAGFAGETDEDFETTRANLEKFQLSQIHTFPYSVRKGTTGASFLNQVDENVKTERANIIKEISKKKYAEFVNKNIGKVKNVLIEKHPDRLTGALKGVSENYLTVILNSKDKNILNTMVNAKISEYKNGILYADII